MTAQELWPVFWEKSLDKEKQFHPEFDPSEYYTSGRASKAWPNKEDVAWWAVNGPLFVESWVQWRDNSGLTIWEVPDENGELIPAIELEVMAYGPDDLKVRSIIDRVFEDPEGDLRIVDLKSGSHVDPWPLQMALNNLGLISQYDRPARWAGYWEARKGGVLKWHDLSRYSEGWLWEQVWNAREIRNQQLFVAKPNNLCASACGVAAHCVAMGGTPFFRKSATMTQNQEKDSGVTSEAS